MNAFLRWRIKLKKTVFNLNFARSIMFQKMYHVYKMHIRVKKNIDSKMNNTQNNIYLIY